MSTYADRLIEALTLRKLGQSDLARLIGIKPQSIQYLCSSKVRSSKFTFEIANALDINPTWLALGSGHIINTENSKKGLINKSSLIPIIGWSELQNYFHHPEKQATDFETGSMILVDSEKENCFALKVPDNSMLPKFEPGSIAIFNPTINGLDLNQKFILAYLQKDNTFIFRKLISTSNKKLIIPTNENFFKEMMLDKNDKILGFLIENRTEFL